MNINGLPDSDHGSQYRDSRLYREWIKVLADYRIEWEDRTAPQCPCPRLHLNQQELDLYLVNHYQFDWRTTFRDLFVLPASGTALVGDYAGSFSLIHHFEISPGRLLWCPECNRSFFRASTFSLCPECTYEKTWLVEDKNLSWFGYPGAVNFHPFNQDDDPFRKQAQHNLTTALASDAMRSIANEGTIESLDAEALAMIEKFRKQQMVKDAESRSVSPTRPQAEPFWKDLKESSRGDDLFSEVAAKSASAREEGNWEKLKSALSGPARVHGWPRIEAIDGLASMYPNFDEVCEFVRAEVRLGPYRKQAQMRIPNLLIVGGPSCGKSSFCKRLADILAPGDWQSFDLGHNPPDFELVGADSSYTNSKEGRVIRLLASNSGSPVRNPVLILDELDKVDPEVRHSVIPALLGLLEKNDARHFRDGFFGVPVDASGIQFLATANDRHLIKGPLASRFELFTVADYTSEQFADVVVPNIYLEWTVQFHEGTFPGHLSRETCQWIAEEAAFVPRRVAAILVGLASQGWGEFRPVPTFESLGVKKEAP